MKTLKFVVDPSLPDIILEPKSNILADRWISFTLKFPYGEGDTDNITEWKVRSDNSSSEPVWSGEGSQRFLIREAGEYTLSITNKREHTNTLNFPVGPATYDIDTDTSGSLNIPNDIGVISSDMFDSIDPDESSITTITIGADVAIIEPGAFSETNVESIEVSEGEDESKYISKMELYLQQMRKNLSLIRLVKILEEVILFQKAQQNW